VARISSSEAWFRSFTEMVIRCPSMTGTRLTCAEIVIGASMWRAPSQRPRILRGSISIFSSSPPPM
jgi:hypothetical protein